MEKPTLILLIAKGHIYSSEFVNDKWIYVSFFDSDKIIYHDSDPEYKASLSSKEPWLSYHRRSTNAWDSLTFTQAAILQPGSHYISLKGVASGKFQISGLSIAGVLF